MTKNRFGTLDQFRIYYCQGVDLKSKIEFLHNEITVSTLVIQKKVDKCLHKFFQNSYPWSLHMQIYTDRLEYWHHNVRQKLIYEQAKIPLKILQLK